MQRRRDLGLLIGSKDKFVNAGIRGEAADDLDELLRLAVQVSGIGIFQTDFDRNWTRFSPELCAILGLPVGTEMTFTEASRLFDERDQAAVRASVDAAARSVERGRWSGLYRVVRADGAVRWVSINGRRIYRDTPSGPQPVRSIGTVIDITQLKETEDALRESERRLRLALDAAQMGTFEADLAGSQAFIDAQEARLLGLPETTRVVSADELRKRVPLEDLASSDVKKRLLTEAGKAYHHEFRFVMPDGSERWLSAHADIRSERIFGVNFDVTERKRAEAALRESEARLRVAVDGAALGVFEWDARTDHAVWENERMYQIFGRSIADGPLSKREFVSEYLHHADVHAFETALQEAMQTGRHFHSVCRVNLKDGSRRWLQIEGNFGSTGNQSRLLGIVADITKRKRLERRAQRLTDRLATIQEEERQRIGQELHDSTVQHLVAASLTLMQLRSQSTGGEERLWSEVDALLQEAMNELRTFGYLLHPPELRARRLRAALRDYIEGFARRSSLYISLRSSPKVDKLPLPLQRSLFRIVQEALANVYRHASAAHVSIQFRWIGERLHLVITDDGRGVNGETTHRRRPGLRLGTGLHGMRARLDAFAGELRIIHRKRNGTRLHATIPVCHGAHKAWARGESAEARVKMRRPGLKSRRIRE